jgi:Zn-dependent alcohol dehydrogenase
VNVVAPVLHAPNEPMRLEELTLDRPREREVLVRMAATGVCHSCLHAADGTHSGIPMPIVLGDEGAGVVEDVGPGCTRVAPGDRVIVSWAPGCSGCRACAQGLPALCQRQPPFGVLGDGETRFHLGGDDVYHYGPATYAPAIVVPESAAIPIRDEMPLDVAAMIGCAVTAGFGSVVNAARVRAGQSVVVFGCGGVGLSAVQAAALGGAHPLVAADVVGSKLDLAKRFGATHGVDVSAPDAVEELRELTHGGADACIVAVGSTRAMEQAVEALGLRGVCVVVGAPPTGRRMSLDPLHVLNGERRLVGSKYGSANPAIEFPKLVDLYLDGRLRLDELVTRRYRLDEADAAFADLAAGELARGLIVFDGAPA